MGGCLSASPAAHAQCLPLAVLTSELTTKQTTSVEGTQAQLPASEWEAHPAGTGAGYWLYVPAPGASVAADPPTRLDLRRLNQETQADLVFKTTQRECVQALRAELRRQGLKPEQVTCPSCEAERFSTTTYTVTLYSQPDNFAAGRAPYPYQVVVHPLAAPTPGQ